MSVKQDRRPSPARRRPETRVVTGVEPLELEPRDVARVFRGLLQDGARLLPAGRARRDPSVLLSRRYLPRHAVTLFDTTYYLTDFRFEQGLDFFVVFVAKSDVATGAIRAVYPRIVYKDSSLVWRVASHVVRTDGEDWIGKGDVRVVHDEDGEHVVTDEDTTNLPYEIQTAFDRISRRGTKRRDDAAVGLVLRNGPVNRIRPYADFSAPRQRAAEAYPLYGGRPVARITRSGDPGSLRFAPGFAPDLDAGIVEVGEAGSRLYGGRIHKYRVLSSNRRVQYQFVASPTHVWINPPQALTTEITTYGIRALHVPADEEIFLAGYEYHIVDDAADPAEILSQIPEGFAGAPSALDPGRADASAWIERLPVIREFRARVLAGPRRRAPRSRPAPRR